MLTFRLLFQFCVLIQQADFRPRANIIVLGRDTDSLKSLSLSPFPFLHPLAPFHSLPYFSSILPPYPSHSPIFLSSFSLPLSQCFLTSFCSSVSASTGCCLLRNFSSFSNWRTKKWCLHTDWFCQLEGRQSLSTSSQLVVPTFQNKSSQTCIKSLLMCANSFHRSISFCLCKMI